MVDQFQAVLAAARAGAGRRSSRRGAGVLPGAARGAGGAVAALRRGRAAVVQSLLTGNIRPMAEVKLARWA